MLKYTFSIVGMCVLLAVACSERAPEHLDAQLATSLQIEKIQAGVKSPYRMTNAYTARSKAHKNAWFIAARLTGPGMDDRPRVAVWMHLRGPDDPGLLMSVNSYAKDFSEWADGSRTKAEVTMSDPPASALRRFVENK